MNRTIARREPDGSVHYTHCFSEEPPRPPCFERPRSLQSLGGRPPLRGLRFLGAALTVATALFWAAMLTSPPTSEARLTPPPKRAACIEAGRTVGAWFEAERHRRAWVQTSGYANFTFMLAWFNAAKNQCASGMIERSVENFRAIESMIAAMDDRHGPGDDDHSSPEVRWARDFFEDHRE